MRFEVPEDVRTFLRSVAQLNQQLRSLSEELAQYFEPMVVRWQHFVKTAAPIASAVMSEFEKWNIASEVLGRAGWLRALPVRMSCLVSRIGAGISHGDVRKQDEVWQLQSFIKTLVDDDDRNIGDFTPRGLYELYIFRRLTMALREKHPAENNECIYGPFQDIVSEQDRKRLEQDPVPNRHAAMHGYVVYSSQQNSLNAIFMADYILGVV